LLDVETRALGRSGLKISGLGLGTMTWGNGTDPDEAAAILVAFHDAGGTFVDTAVSYNSGVSEQILGALIADVVPRSELVIASKAGITRVGEERFVDASRGALLRRLDESLTNLGVDHIDLWQIHTADPSVPVEETLSALDAAVASGKVRYVGVSNYSGWRTAQAATWQRAVPGRAPLVSNQVRYSLLDRGIEREVVPACAELGLGILPFSPLAGGVLTGKYRHGVPADSRGAAEGRNLASFSEPRTVGIVEAVATAADGLATSPLTVALSWLRNRPGVAAPIVGARTLGQLTAAIQSLSVELPLEIRSALDDVSTPASGYPEELH
jgi:aryl-alcohol dehydrogenase-like predicted oxidoreductase